MREKTIINGDEVWFAVCCQNECHSIYLGPYLTEESAKRECNLMGCEWAHFIAQFVPPFAKVECGNYWTSAEIYLFSDWVATHNVAAYEHPIFQHREKHVDSHWDVEKGFEWAVREATDGC